MNINVLKKFIIKLIKKNKNIYLKSIIHLIYYFLFRNYRKKRCLIDPSTEFFYKNRKLANYFSTPLLIVAKYLKKRKIFISINNAFNHSTGHIYAEIDQIQRMQYVKNKYLSSTIWFTTSKLEILDGTKDIFQNKNFKIFFGGIKRIFLTFVAMADSSIVIDGSLSQVNYILGKNYSNREVFNNFSKLRARLKSDSQEFYPNKAKLSNYVEETSKLMHNLNITKKYVVIQIKTEKVNGTIEILNPGLLLDSIKYFQDKNYQIVFVGREPFPDVFLNKSIIDYANSKYASSLNDFLLIGHCSLVIASASGFCCIPESLDKPLLITNAHHIIQQYGRRTIYLPTLLSRKSKKFNAKIQHIYLCTYGADCGYNIFDDFYIHHMPTSEEILMGAKELEEMLSDKPSPLTPLQKKTLSSNSIPLLRYGLSRISHYYLTKHEYFFENKK
jgi:putative glycosyltransferase (TIGR04372 family)